MDKFKENNLILYKGGSSTSSKTMVVDLFEFAIHNVTNNKYKLGKVENRRGQIYAIHGGFKDIIDSSCEPIDTLIEVPTFKLKDTNIIDIIRHLNKIYLSYEVRKRENFGNFWLDKDNVRYVIDLLFQLSKLLPKNKEDHTYIRCLSVSQDSRVIVIGDIHGSFHSIFRILLRLHRLGLLDISNLILSPKVYLIFLGDVVDRGFFSLEILLLIFLLLKNNPNNVFYNRGNHEEEEINYRDGLREEIQIKSCNKNDLCETARILFQSLNLFFKGCSSAIIINRSVYLAHGGFNKFSDYSALNSFLDENSSGIFYIKDIERMSIGTLQDLTGTFTRWSDFGFSCQNRGFDNNTCIKPEDLDSFLNKTNLKFIIRGHQDNGDNNVLFASRVYNPPKHNYPMYGISLSNLRKSEIEPNSFIRYNNDIPFCRINIDEIAKSSDRKINNISFFPVLTTSTNTDFQRNLRKDGFVILHWVDDTTVFEPLELRNLPRL